MSLTARALHSTVWTEELYSQVKQFLESKTIPADVTGAQPIYRWKKKYGIYSLINDEIYLVLSEGEAPFWSVDKKSGEKLFDVSYPIKLKVVYKESDKKEIITEAYTNIQLGGYRGVLNIYDRITKEYLGITKDDVKKQLLNIEVHQINHISNSDVVVEPILSTFQNERWNCDLIDLASYSKSNNDVTFLLVVIDHFTSFVFVVPLKNKSSVLIANELQFLIYREGAPSILQTDNGGEFVNDEIAELCTRFQIKQVTGEPYHSQTNGKVERVNRTLQDTIYKYQAQYDTRRYVDNLQAFVYSYNSSLHSTSKLTPFQVYRKRDVRSSILNTLVAKRIADNGQKMVDKSVKSINAFKEPLAIGDHVRIDTKALKSTRKLGKITAKGRNNLTWSKEIYLVNNIYDEEKVSLRDGGRSPIPRYQIVTEDGDPVLDEDESRTFFRHQLLKISLDELEATKTKKDKPDLNFGKFDNENHLVQLGLKKSEMKEANLTEKQYEELKEEEDEKEQKKEKTLRKQGLKPFVANSLEQKFQEEVGKVKGRTRQKK